MKNQILLYQLQRLMENLPDFSAYEPDSKLHASWLGSAYALVYQWKPFPAISLSSAIEFMPIKAERNKNIERVLNVLSYAISELEFSVTNSVPAELNQQSSADVEEAISTLILTAHENVLITDIFLDSEILQKYLTKLQGVVNVRLLVRECGVDFHAALEKAQMQSGLTIEVRIAPAISDRLIFIDELSCWMLDGPVKNSDTTISSSLAPLSADLVKIKRAHYETLWSQANKIN